MGCTPVRCTPMGPCPCWGPGHEGQLGLGNTETHHLPVAVPGIGDAVAVAAGSAFTCVAHRDGGVSCWGRSWWGQLGVHTEESNRSTPGRVPGLTDTVAISAGQDHSCAVHRDGGVSCWGWVYGDTPFRVTGVGPVSSVSSGGTRTCVTTVDGDVYCWDLETTTVPQPSESSASATRWRCRWVTAPCACCTAMAASRAGGGTAWARSETAPPAAGRGRCDSIPLPVRRM